ncbi:hypothetical protein [Litoribrevibacter albus]|uniref:hypothetical protein n=1 Tax=Litoribrevibacter albus TaxID=1473156 RepID=UPI0024E0C63B|nr:hypothetical protein [Litoribrevibacter albus]
MFVDTTCSTRNCVCNGLVVLLVMFSSMTMALDEFTYQCQAEAGAGIEHTGKGNIAANLYDVSSLKLMLTNKTGQWQVWENDDSEPIFANCQSQYRCEPKEGFYGVFYMTKDHLFTYIIQKAYGSNLERQIVFTFKGMCTEVEL